jgi:hypothetical protein
MEAQLRPHDLSIRDCPEAKPKGVTPGHLVIATLESSLDRPRLGIQKLHHLATIDAVERLTRYSEAGCGCVSRQLAGPAWAERIEIARLAGGNQRET